MGYTWKCSRDSIICQDQESLDSYGWVIFAVLMAAYLLKDVISGAKMIVYSGKSHPLRRRAKFFFGGVFLCSVTLFILYASAVYNSVIATSNTDMIVNSVAILFIMEVDERFYEILESTGQLSKFGKIYTGEDEKSEAETQDLLRQITDIEYRMASS